MPHIVTGCPPLPLQGGAKVCDDCACTFGTAQCHNERDRRMRDMDLQQIMAAWLAANGYDGLSNHCRCGCGLGDFMPCKGTVDGRPTPDCRPSVRIECREGCEFQGDWCDGPDDVADGGCWTTAMQPRRAGF